MDTIIWDGFGAESERGASVATRSGSQTAGSFPRCLSEAGHGNVGERAAGDAFRDAVTAAVVTADGCQ